MKYDPEITRPVLTLVPNTGTRHTPRPTADELGAHADESMITLLADCAIREMHALLAMSEYDFSAAQLQAFCLIDLLKSCGDVGAEYTADELADALTLINQACQEQKTHTANEEL